MDNEQYAREAKEIVNQYSKLSRRILSRATKHERRAFAVLGRKVDNLVSDFEEDSDKRRDPLSEIIGSDGYQLSKLLKK
ncbi:MAG: hypothetical protein PVJ67_05645 [Candidatus Pacearchaeota archaeon]|jgi:hypothetical protein